MGRESDWPPKNNKTVDGIHPENPEIKSILENLQANILKASGRDQAYHIFLKFKIIDQNPDQISTVKKWIKNYAENYVTSALKQYEDSKKRREINPNWSGGLLGCFFLSCAGYRALGYDPDEKFDDPAFKRGMKNRGYYKIRLPSGLHTAPNLDPEPVPPWNEDYHAMLLLAQNLNEIKPSLECTVKKIEDELEDITVAIVKEHGRRLVNSAGQDLEHFGYRDGISNPLFFMDEIYRFKSANPTIKHDPSADLNLVLVKDPFSDKDHHKGSYLVFRKLKQDVCGFKKALKALSEKVHHEDQNLTAAQIVGRFRDGTPITDYKKPQSDNPEVDEADFNSMIRNFNYKNDPNGLKCPMSAHIRQANIRIEKVRGTRIVRRGIPYGRPGDKDVGLLFMCYQSSIHTQFEFIQRFWLDNPYEPLGKKPGQDPLIGQFEEKKWPVAHNSDETSPGSFGGYVTLQGGEYFFAPSIPFLKKIADS